MFVSKAGALLSVATYGGRPLAGYNHSSLFCIGVSDEEKSFVTDSNLD